MARDLAGEHGLARILIVAVTGKALCGAIIDRRRAAPEQHQRVAEEGARGDLGVIGLGVGLADVEAEATLVVVAEEGRVGRRHRR